MTRSDVPLCSWNSPAPLAGNTGLYLCRSVSAKQSGWLQNLWTDAGTWVHCTKTCSRYQPLWPATWSSASFIDTWESISQNVIDEAVSHGESDYVQAWRQKWHHFEHLLTETGSFQSQHTTQPALFRATNSLPRKTCCFASFPSQLFKRK